MSRTLRTVLFLVLLGLAACADPGAAPPSAEEAAALERASVEAVIRPGILELRRWREPRQRVVIDRAGIAAGPVGAPLTRKLFVEPGRLEDLQFFVRTYAPFRQRSEGGELAFGGQGRFRAGPVERRMILEWARKVAAEIGGQEGGGTSYGLVLSWHRGGAVGTCDDLAVYLSGEVRAKACAWDQEVRGRLRPEPLARMYGWYERLRPFQEAGAIETERAQAPARLTFAGRGSGAGSPEDVAELRTLAAGLYRELALRRGPLPAEPGEALVPPAAPGRPRGARGEAPPEPSPKPLPPLLLPEIPPGIPPRPDAKLPPFVMPPPREGDQTGQAGQLPAGRPGGSQPLLAAEEDDQRGRHGSHQRQ